MLLYPFLVFVVSVLLFDMLGLFFYILDHRVSKNGIYGNYESILWSRGSTGSRKKSNEGWMFEEVGSSGSRYFNKQYCVKETDFLSKREKSLELSNMPYKKCWN